MPDNLLIKVSDFCLEASQTDLDADETAFMERMSIHSLVRLEKTIIQVEYSITKNGPRPPRWGNERVEQDKADYKFQRAKLEAEIPNFSEIYKSVRDVHNSCARKNLDNCNGNIFSYVLPVFHSDGSHEPWGEKDVPWNA